MLNVDQLPKPEVSGPSHPFPQAVACRPLKNQLQEADKVVVIVEHEDEDEQTALLGMGECRICQEEDSLNNLESPCACSGSLKVYLLS